MDLEQATAAIGARWLSQWPTLSGGVPYSLDNIVAPENALPRAAVNVVCLDSSNYSIGQRAKVLHEGLIDVRLYGRVGRGRRELDALVGKVRKIFQRRRFGGVPGVETGVLTYASSVTEIRRDRDSSGLWILSVATDFEFYEIVPGT